MCSKTLRIFDQSVYPAIAPRSHAELLELQLVLETGAQFFDDAAQSASAAHSERADDAGACTT